MKNFIKSIILFIPFTLVIYSILLLGWGRFAPQSLKPNFRLDRGYGHMNSRIKELKDVNDIDILIVGSSHAYRGFDPRIFAKHGFKTFNLGSSSQTPIQTKLLLNRYLGQLNPKIVLYEVFPNAFSVDGVESALDIIANDENDIYSLKMALDVNNIIVINSLIYTVLRESILDILKIQSSYIEPRVIGPDTYIPGGYVEKDSLLYIEVPMLQGGNKWDLKKKHLKNFKKSLMMLKERNIKMFFIYAPISSALYNSYCNNSTFDCIMSEYDEYGEYFNFNEFMNLNDTLHFTDSDHLNPKGVKVFNEKLLDTLNLGDYL